MTNEDTYSPESVQRGFAQLITDKAIEIFGDNIANPEHEPLRFKYQLKVVQFALEAGAK